MLSNVLEIVAGGGGQRSESGRCGVVRVWFAKLQLFLKMGHQAAMRPGRKWPKYFKASNGAFMPETNLKRSAFRP